MNLCGEPRGESLYESRPPSCTPRLEKEKPYACVCHHDSFPAVVVLLAVPAVAQPPEPSGPPPAAKGWKATTVAEGLVQPWGMAWLPDGRLLITTKGGALHVWNGKEMGAIATDGLPEVFSRGRAR
jgi:glucose/arabinose dehydrogenase